MFIFTGHRSTTDTILNLEYGKEIRALVQALRRLLDIHVDRRDTKNDFSYSGGF
jgi:hypothetical protein